MQIQQKSCLQLRQVMWLHPWFFSMRALQAGHLRVLARIQFAVSDSLTHLSAHSASCAQEQGSWASSPVMCAMDRAADRRGVRVCVYQRQRH
jgi:hypothetical protein